jgi:hypothetical protein
MNPELEKGMRCLKAFTELHEYIQDKDIGGECIMRVNSQAQKAQPGDEIYTDHLFFYFEFPIEYQSMCTQVYYPEAVECFKDLTVTRVEIIPKIAAGNRYKSTDIAQEKCALLIVIPATLWSHASSWVFYNARDIAQGRIDDVAIFTADLVMQIHELISTISTTTNAAGKLISDDPEDSNYMVSYKED